nr:hypothetical protein [Tanacetum cinerariifolium]
MVQRPKLYTKVKSDFEQPSSGSPFRPPFSNRNELVDHPIVDLTGDKDPTDEDRDTGMGDLTGVSVYLGGEILLEETKSQESNIGGSDNTGDRGKIAGRTIKARGGGIASYACMIYGSLWRVRGKSILNIVSRVVGRRHNGNTPVSYSTVGELVEPGFKFNDSKMGRNGCFSFVRLGSKSRGFKTLFLGFTSALRTSWDFLD